MSASRHHLTATRIALWALLLAVGCSLLLSGVASARPALERSQSVTHGKNHAKKKAKKRKKARRRARAAVAPINLCAKQRDDYPLPGGGTAPIWGFVKKPADKECDDPTVVAEFPAPALDVVDGETVTLNITNLLPSDLQIDIPGITLAPGPASVPAASGPTTPGTGSVTFDANGPGTFMYESSGDAGRQSELGLAGALIIRPQTLSSPAQAYDAVRSAYEVEPGSMAMVLGEITPGLNAAAASTAGPGSFDMYVYDDPVDHFPGGASTLRPTYRFINGQSHPDLQTIKAHAGDRVLLRYVNAGSEHAVMTMLGLNGTVVGRDGALLETPFGVTAETIPAGSTLDVIVKVPSGAQVGDTFPIYDRHLALVNGSAGNAPGGRLQFLEVN